MRQPGSYFVLDLRATPDTAYVTEVQLKQLRGMGGVNANPETGRAEREDSTTWRPGPNQIPMPGGRDPWFR